jgi:hypothetical protein
MCIVINQQNTPIDGKGEWGLKKFGEQYFRTNEAKSRENCNTKKRHHILSTTQKETTNLNQ